MEELLQLSDLYVFDDRILNALHYLTPQRRERWFCMMFRRDLEITPSWPTPNLEAAESFRIRNILPIMNILLTGFTTRIKHVWEDFDARWFSTHINYNSKCQNSWWRNLPIHEKAMAFGLPPTWLHPENEALANTMIGNMVAVQWHKSINKAYSFAPWPSRCLELWTICPLTI